MQKASKHKPSQKQSSKHQQDEFSQLKQVELVGPPSQPIKKRSKLTVTQTRNEPKESIVGEKLNNVKSPLTPMNQKERMKGYGIGFEAGVINMQKYQGSFASNKQSAEGKRQAVPPQIAVALAKTSNQQQSALTTNITQHNTKSIDDYKTQISNQIKIIKQGAKSGMPPERNVGQGKSPKNSWHVSFKKVAADRQPQMNYQEVFNSRSEASPMGNLAQADSFTSAQRQADYLAAEYSYDGQNSQNMKNYPRNKLESGADSLHLKIQSQIQNTDSKGFLPNIDQKSMQQLNPAHVKRSGSNLRNFDDKIASHIQSAQARNYQLSQGSMDPRAEATLMSAGSQPSKSVRVDKASKLRDGSNQQRVVTQVNNPKQLTKRSSQILQQSGTRNQGSVSLDPRATQNMHMSQIKDKQERQLEDLNETLQRLAREKYTKNTPGGAGGLQGGKRKRQAENNANSNMGGILGQIGFDPNNVLKQFDPIAAQLAEINAAVQARKEKKKKKAQKPAEKPDKIAKQQESQMFIGDALVNQRLQGIKGVEKARDQQKSPMQTSAKKPKEPESQQMQQRPNIQISNDDPLVLKNVNIVKATKQFGQTQQSSGMRRYPYNLIHSDAEDSSPEVFMHHKSPTKVSEFAIQTSPTQQRLYLTQGKGFDVLAGGQKFSLDGPSVKTPATGQSPIKGPMMPKESQSSHKANLVVATRQFSSVIEDDNEQLTSPQAIKNNRERMKNMSIAREAALKHQNSAEAVRESMMRQSFKNDMTQRPVIQPQQPQVTKAQIIEQIKQLYSSPKRISGIQLIKCEAEDIDNDVSNVNDTESTKQQANQNIEMMVPESNPSPHFTLRQSMNDISPKNDVFEEKVTVKFNETAAQLHVPAGTNLATQSEEEQSLQSSKNIDQENPILANLNSATASKAVLSQEDSQERDPKIYIGESNLNQQDSLVLPPRENVSISASRQTSAQRMASKVSSRNEGSQKSQSNVSRQKNPDTASTTKPPKGISRNHTMSLDVNASSNAVAKRNSTKPIQIQLANKKLVTDSGRVSSRNSKQGKDSLSVPKEIPLPPAKKNLNQTQSKFDSPSKRDNNSKERMQSSRPEKQKQSAVKPDIKMTTSPKPTSFSPMKQSQASPSKKMDKPSIIKESKRQGRNRDIPTSSNYISQRVTPAPKVEVDDGYVSSDTPEQAWNQQVGQKVTRENYSFCTEYVMMRGNYTKRMPRESKHLFTRRRYFKKQKKENDGDMVTIQPAEGEDEPNFTWSQRLFLSRESVISEDRRRLPVLIINVDGVLGYWDDNNKFYFVLRQKIMESLIQLSYDFRLVAVSSQRSKLLNKLIIALMNMPAGAEAPSGGDANNISSLRHLIFDAVYQLRSQNNEAKFANHLKNVDEIHFDLSQVLLDMQFKPHKKEGAKKEANKEFQTFWETESYRPWQKVMIVTTERDMLTSKCYSFDYNYLFSAQKFRYEESKRMPLVIQVPHLRLQPRQSFEPVLQLIFGLQTIALAQSQRKQPDQKYYEGQMVKNPDLNAYECCKKILTTKYKFLIGKQRKTMLVKGLRVFDQEDPFVDLEMINFCQAYTFLKWHYRGNRVVMEDEKEKRRSDWLQIKKYYLKYQPGKEPISPTKIKQNLKVTFEESPEIRRMGDERDKASSQMRGAATAYDSSKSDRFSIAKTAFTNEDAKNAYNGLMIRNYKIQQEINQYARHYRIQSQKKIEMKRKLDKIAAKEDDDESPIVIFDGDERDRPPALKSNLKKSVQSIREMMVMTPRKEKSYAFKYRVFKVKTRDPIEEAGEYDFSKHQVVNLQVNPVLNASVKAYESQTPKPQAIAAVKRLPNQDYKSHSFSAVMNELTRDKGRHAENALVELLSKRQTKIGYTTNQEMHLKNNLNQLIDGEQQYKDQHQQLIETEKEQVLSARAAGVKTETDYIDKI